MKAIALLEQFFAQLSTRITGNNAWLDGEDLNVYVRKGARYIHGTKLTALDIANVTAKQRGQGDFTRFLAEAEKLNPYIAIYVENVFEPRFGKFLKRKGYVPAYGTEPQCYIKLRAREWTLAPDGPVAEASDLQGTRACPLCGSDVWQCVGMDYSDDDIAGWQYKCTCGVSLHVIND